MQLCRFGELLGVIVPRVIALVGFAVGACRVVVIGVIIGKAHGG